MEMGMGAADTKVDEPVKGEKVEKQEESMVWGRGGKGRWRKEPHNSLKEAHCPRSRYQQHCEKSYYHSPITDIKSTESQ